MSHTPPTLLGPTALEAFEQLSDSLEQNGGLTLEDATEVLTDSDLDAVTAQKTIEQLRPKGVFYEVKGQLFLTPIALCWP